MLLSVATVVRSIDCHAESSVTPVTPSAWSTQYIVFAGAQQLAAANPLFNVVWPRLVTVDCPCT